MSKKFLQEIDKQPVDDETHRVLLYVYYFLEETKLQNKEIDTKRLNELLGDVASGHLVSLINLYKKYDAALSDRKE